MRGKLLKGESLETKKGTELPRGRVLFYVLHLSKSRSKTEGCVCVGEEKRESGKKAEYSRRGNGGRTERGQEKGY